MNEIVDRDDVPADPAAMLDMMREQERRTQQWSYRIAVLQLTIWAFTWIVGFFFLWSSEATGGNPWFRVPAPLAWTVFGVTMALAAIASIVAGIRSGAGVRGPSKLSGAMYGWSWSISMVGAWLLLNAAIRAGMSTDVVNLIAPALFILIVGVLYLAGGALWHSPAQFVLGCVMIVTAVVASFVGSPTHYLIYATVGPASMLIVAALLARGILPSEGAR